MALRVGGKSLCKTDRHECVVELELLPRTKNTRSQKTFFFEHYLAEIFYRVGSDVASE
jgi:hypothetical protein